MEEFSENDFAMLVSKKNQEIKELRDEIEKLKQAKEKKELDDVSEELLKKLAVPEAKSNRNISLDPYEREDSYAEHLINKYTVK